MWNYITFETYFVFVFIVVGVYVIFGKYLYFRKVVPALNTAPGMLPSTQMKHVEGYVALLIEKGERPWFLFYLKKGVRLILRVKSLVKLAY